MLCSAVLIHSLCHVYLLCSAWQNCYAELDKGCYSLSADCTGIAQEGSAGVVGVVDFLCCAECALPHTYDKCFTVAHLHIALVQMWDLLVWRGKHPQAPVTVAAKPNYFSELDMKKTIENLLTHHPQFFASDQMLRSLTYGDITAMDRLYFCQVWPAPTLCMPGLATSDHHAINAPITQLVTRAAL